MIVLFVFHFLLSPNSIMNDYEDTLTALPNSIQSEIIQLFHFVSSSIFYEESTVLCC